MRLFTAGFSFAHASEISQRLMWYREREREGEGEGEGGRKLVKHKSESKPVSSVPPCLLSASSFCPSSFEL